MARSDGKERQWLRGHLLAGLTALTAWLPAPPARAGEGIGTAWDAQPGLHRVAVAESTEPAVAATAGYGLTEAQDEADGAHHRGTLRLAGALSPLPWLNVGPVVDGRYDQHAGDSGSVIDAALATRVVSSAGDFRLGAELRAWVPGSESASTSLGALSVDSRLLAGVWLGKALLAVSGGYRFDRSAEAGQGASRLSFDDRLALGLSDFDAVLVGLGLRAGLGRSELIGEVSGDLLVGGGSPPLSQSPLRATGGIRQALSKRLAAEFLVGVSLSARPELAPSAPLVPVEPRLSALAGIRYRFADGSESPPRPAPDREAKPTHQPPPPPPPPPPALASLEITVVDEQDLTIDDPKIVLKTDSGERSLTRDVSGRYRDDRVPVGQGTLVVEAQGYEPVERPITLAAEAPQKLEVRMKALPQPSQVRGVVRSFGGLGLAARVSVSPLGLETTTDATGAFQIDVPPGAYEVTIEADGYETQRRSVRVDPEGVVVLNADLVKQRGKQ